MLDLRAPTLCLIPARGGSKGVPGKNLLEIAGRPLLEWTIEAALGASAALRIVVSTDDPAIAQCAQAAGAEVPFIRPAQLAQDSTATEPVVEHALDELERAEGYRPEQVMLLQATSPVRLPGTLDRALEQFKSSGADSLVSVLESSPFVWRIGPEGAQPEYDIAARPRRQEMTPEQMRYRENGSLYLTKTALYREQHNRLGGRIELFILDPVEGADIDTPADVAYTQAQLLGLAAQAPIGATRS